MTEVILDEHGWPVLLADVPDSGGVSVRKTGAQGGNPRHDARSGKFTEGSTPKKRPSAPANVDPREFARFRDAVREAARQFGGDLSEEKLMGFIQKRAQNPGAVNIQQFLQLVEQQQLDDIVDIIHAESKNLRGVKLAAPRGFLAKLLAGRSEENVSEIIERLEARGIKDAGIIVGKKLPKERQAEVRESSED